MSSPSKNAKCMNVQVSRTSGGLSGRGNAIVGVFGVIRALANTVPVRRPTCFEQLGRRSLLLEVSQVVPSFMIHGHHF